MRRVWVVVFVLVVLAMLASCPARVRASPQPEARAGSGGRIEFAPAPVEPGAPAVAAGPGTRPASVTDPLNRFVLFEAFMRPT